MNLHMCCKMYNYFISAELNSVLPDTTYQRIECIHTYAIYTATLSLLTHKIQYIHSLLFIFFLKLVHVIHDNPGRKAYFLVKWHIAIA